VMLQIVVEVAGTVLVAPCRTEKDKCLSMTLTIREMRRKVWYGKWPSVGLWAAAIH